MKVLFAKRKPHEGGVKVLREKRKMDEGRTKLCLRNSSLHGVKA